LVLALPLAAQTLVVDRPLADGPGLAQAVERGAKGAYADAFRIGAAGQVWMIQTVRVWAIPSSAPSCPRELGDQVEKITLYGALDNPPVPGVPVCDCHALVALATAALQPGSGASTNPGVIVTPEKGMYRLDFRDVRWSVPGDSETLFTVRVTSRRPQSCNAAAGWALAAARAKPEYRLHLLNDKGVPVGLEPARREPRMVHVQVWAERTK
jgi:hypothetical protein